MLLFIRLAVEEGRTLQHIHFVIHLFCNRRQLPESLPAFSIATKKKGKERGRGKNRDNNACAHVYAHVKGVG